MGGQHKPLLYLVLGSALASAHARSPVHAVQQNESFAAAVGQKDSSAGASLDQLMTAGIAASRAGRYPEAISNYRKALLLDPKCTPALINMGLAFFKSGNYKDAAPPLEKAMQLGVDTDQIHTLLAMSYFSLHRYKEAGSHFEILFEKEPSNQTLQYYLAESLMRAHQAEELPKLVEKLHAVSPDSPVVHMLAGEQYDRLGNTDNAIHEFQQAAATAGDMPLVHFALGYLYWGKHRYKEAAQEFHIEAGLPNGEQAQALGFLGDIAMKNGDQAEAERLFRESMRIEPEIRIVQYDLGILCAEKKQNAEAIQHLKAAIALDPGSADAYYRLAMVFRQLGQPDQQRALLAKVAQLNEAQRQSVGQTIAQKP